jgi:hypothetical protein
MGRRMVAGLHRPIAACISQLDTDAQPRTEWIGQGWRTTTDVECAGGDEALERLNDARASSHDHVRH